MYKQKHKANRQKQTNRNKPTETIKTNKQTNRQNKQTKQTMHEEWQSNYSNGSVAHKNGTTRVTQQEWHKNGIIRIVI